MTATETEAPTSPFHATFGTDHVGLNLPPDSFGFWQEMLRRLGFDIRADGANHFDAVTGAAHTMLCVTATTDGRRARYHRKDTGLGHLAFRLHSRAAVDAFVTDFLTPHGIEPLYGGPKEYDYADGYYAVYSPQFTCLMRHRPLAVPSGSY